MSRTIQMLEFCVDPLALVRFAQGHGHNRQHDEDLGYALHAWLAAAFGSLAPKPFRLFAEGTRGRPSRVLAYGQHSRAELVDHMNTYAEPAAYSVCPPDSLAAKPLPGSWELGRTYGFEVLTCPITRKEGIEKDVFLRQADRQGADGEVRREDVYRRWLVSQFRDAAEAQSVDLAGFRLIRLHRRGGAGGAVFLTRPQALLTGRLRIRDSEAFCRLIARGIGRHRAFGYGMILLRPA